MDSNANAAPTTSGQPDQPTQERQSENDTESLELQEIALNSLDFNTGATTSFALSKPNLQTISFINENQTTSRAAASITPTIFKNNRLLSINNQSVIFTQPHRTFSNLPSPISLNISVSNQPQSLFQQALTKLNNSNLSLAVLNNLKSLNPKAHLGPQAGELSPPDSLTSAPPSYSFVLRQMANRRRPRLMGTFIPSPSFVQHTPPPNYAAAFDIYVDNPMPSAPPRVFNYGFTPIPTVCPDCGYAGLSVTISKITLCTHLCAFILCLFCCWVCAPLPYVLRSCKDVYHYCRNCRGFLGMYSATSPENVYP